MLEIQKFILSHPDNWEELLKHSPYCLTIKHEGGFAIFNYNLFESDLSLDIVQEARGIILDEEDNFSVACFPFKKFFNYGEPNAARIDWKTAKIQTKIDGSIIKLWWNKHKNFWQVSTNGMIDAYSTILVSPHIENGTQTKNFGVPAVECFSEQNILWGSLDKQNTYIFELVSLYNQQVIEYKEPAVWHIGTRNNKTFEELDVDIGIQKPKEWAFTTIEECIDVASKFKDEQEGFVVVDKKWNRVKIKSPYYVLASHSLNDNISLSKVINIYLSGDYEEFLSYFPKYRDIIEKIEKYIAFRVTAIECTVDRLNTSDSYKLPKKDFYLAVKQFKDASYFLKVYDKNSLRWDDDTFPTPKQYVLSTNSIRDDIKNYLRKGDLL